MYKNDMRNNSTYKALFLLNLISYKQCCKKDIISEFEKNGVKVSKTSIVNYINKLLACDVPIKINRNKNKDYYSLDKKDIPLSISKELSDSADDVKKLLSFEKDYLNIKRAMMLFYKFALLTQEKSTRSKLADFGYFSTINWELVKELKEHCDSKDIIELDYILPKGGNMLITMHVDSIKIGSWSQRLYLKGVFHNANKFSQLPVDRIYMIKKVIEKNVRFDFETKILTYKISRDLLPYLDLDDGEIFTGIDKQGHAVIKRPIDDNFYLVQKLLYFCPDLYYISDENIKNLVKEKLEGMKDVYSKRPD